MEEENKKFEEETKDKSEEEKKIEQDLLDAKRKARADEKTKAKE